MGSIIILSVILISSALNAHSIAFTSTFIRNDNLTDQLCVNDTLSSHDRVPSVISCVVQCLNNKPNAVAYDAKDQHCQCHRTDYHPTWLCHPKPGYNFYAKVAGQMSTTASATSTTIGPPLTTGSSITIGPPLTTAPPIVSSTATAPPTGSTTTTASPTGSTTTTASPTGFTTTTAPQTRSTTTTGLATTQAGGAPTTPLSKWEFQLSPGNPNFGVLEVYREGVGGYMCPINNFIGAGTLNAICLLYLKLGTYGFRLPDDYAEVNASSNYDYYIYGMTSCTQSGCDANDWYSTGSGPCTDKPIQIFCTDEFPEAMRWVDGALPDEGRVEVYFAGQWGQICSQATVNEPLLPEVLCRTMNYTGPPGPVTTQTLSPASAYGPMFIERIWCPSNNTSLLQDCNFGFDYLCDPVGDNVDVTYFQCT